MLLSIIWGGSMRYLYSVGGASRKMLYSGEANRRSLINVSVKLKRTKAVNETPKPVVSGNIAWYEVRKIAPMQQATTQR